jgi:hypothetical protein
MILESVKQLYYVITTKELFLEWLLEINLFIGRRLMKALAEAGVTKYVKKSKNINMRTTPNRAKRNIIQDEDVLKARWDLCLGCEFLKENKCEKCGCFMKVKHKLAMAKCPIGKWDRYVT